MTPAAKPNMTGGREWRLELRSVTVRGEPRLVRMTRFRSGWLASTDTESGPTIGYNRSPYLAAWRALEPLGIGMVEAMAAVGRVAGR